MRRAALAALTLAGAAGIPAAAQTVAPEAEVLAPDRGEITPDSTLTATISQSVEADSNYNLDDDSPGTSYYGDTRIGLDYLRANPDGSLALGLDTGLRPLWEAGQDFDVVLASPSSAYLTYEQEGPNTAIDANLRARTRQVNASLPLFNEFGTPVADALNRGQRDTYQQRYDANVGLILGTNSPSTYEFRLIGSNIDYTNESGTNLAPNRSVEGQALWTLAITPVFSTALFGSYLYYNADDDEETELNIAEAEAGLVYNPSENLRIRGGLGYADRHRTGLVPVNGVLENQTVQDEQGLTARGDIRYILPEFSLIGNARWTAAAPTERWTGDLTAVYNLPRGTITGAIFQDFVSTNQGDEARVTGATIGLTRDINNVSRVGLDFAYATQVNQDDPTEPDINRTDVTVSYGYDFTQAVTGEVGYTFRSIEEDPDNATSNRVYFVIGRDFVTGL
jgi:hypothetical protein